MKTIFELQNDESNIKMLAAQRQLYLKAKRIQWVSFVIQVPLAIALTLFIAFFPASEEGASVLSFGIIIFSVIAPMLESSYKSHAAAIQDFFDHKVLQIKWNHIKLQHQPEWADINKEAEEHLAKAGNREKLVNWYFNEPDCIEMPYAALICQRSNMVWDSRLRRRFYRSVFASALLILLIAIFFGWEMPLGELFKSLLLPLIPLFIWSIIQINGNRDSARRLENLKGNVDLTWRKAFTENFDKESLLDEMRQIQDEIYDNRSKAPLIPELLYNQFRSRDDSGMYMGVEELCKEANQMLQQQ